MSRPEPTPVSASSRLKRRALASLCALSFATGTVAVVPAPTANAVAASDHKNQYAGAPANGYAKYTKLDANGSRNNPCNVSKSATHRYGSNADIIDATVDGVGRFMAVKTDDGGNFELQVVAQMGNDQGNGDMFPRYRENASFSFNTLYTAPLKPIGTGGTVKFESRPADDLIVTDEKGDITDDQLTIPLDGNQNTVMAWRFDNTSPHLTAWALANNIDPGSLTLEDVFVSVPMAISATLAPFPDENASCKVMNTTSTPVTMLADGKAHPFEIGLEGVDKDSYGRLKVVVVDKDGKKIEGATVAKGAVVNDQYGLPIAMKTEVTLPKDDERFHNGKGVYLQVYATPRKGDDKRAAAGPNKGTGLSGNYAYSRADAEPGKGLYDTNMKIGGLHAINTPTFSAEHGANSGEPGETISAQIVGADQQDKGVKAGQEFLGENNPTFSLGGDVEYGKDNQGDNKWTNPQVDPDTGEATITVGAGAQGGDLAYVPVKVTNSDGSSFIIKATFTSKQPAPVALQPAFKAGPVGDRLKATPKYTKNGQPYIDPTTVRIVGTDENSDGKTLTVDGQGTWTVDKQTGEFSFTPVAGFVGDPTPIQYTAKGAKGEEPIQPAEVMFSYYPLETREASTYGPVEATQKSTDNNSPGDLGRTTAQLFPGLPSAWYGKADSPVSFQLTSEDGKTVYGTSHTIAGSGTYTIDPVTGVVSFKADPNLLGDQPDAKAATIGIQTVGLTGLDKEPVQLTATYTPNVEKQSFALPNAREDGQTGQPKSATPNYRAFSTDPKTVTMVPVEGNELSEDGKTMVVPGQGTWTVDDKGVFTFTPVTGFVGSPAPVRYEANSRSGQKAEGTGQVAIFYPDPRTLPANTSAAQGVTQKSDDTGERNEGKATKDMFPTLPTAWYGEEDSSVKFDLVDPSGEVVETTNDEGQPTFTVDNVGTYTLNPVTGLATFTPVPSFTGPAPRVEIQTKGITGGEELKAAYNPFVYPVGVEIPSAFKRADQVGSPVDVTPTYERTNEDGTRDELASVQPETIQIVADGLPAGSVISEDKKSVTVPGEGTWTVDEAGKFTFTPLQPGTDADGNPVKGFTGNPTPISYLAKNVQNIDALVPGQVTALYPTIATDDAITTGNKGQTQLSTDTQDGVEDKGLTIEQMFPNLNPEWAKAGMELVSLQNQGTLNEDKTVLTVDGTGTYTLDKAAGTISFAPTENFQGTAPKVGIKLTAVDTEPVAAYTPIVRPFAKPAEDAVVVLPAKVQQGKTGEPVSLTPPLADNIDKSTIKILDAEGNEVDELKVAGGKWTVDKQTGEFTFTPNEGYLGSPAPVKYTAKDRFGTKAEEPGEVSVQYPEQRTADSATSGKVNVNQKSRAFTGGDGMFPTLPAWESNTFALDGAGKDGKIVRDGVGTFYIENGAVVFDPEPGYVGKAEPVAVVATTATGETLTAKYEPVVIGSANDFVLPSKAVEGKLGNPAKITPEYPKNIDFSTIKIVNGDQLVDALEVQENGKKVGEWTVNKETGEFTFTPVAGYLGTPGPVKYTAKNTAGQDAIAPGSVVATYPKPRTADSATADLIDVNQTSREFTGNNGMFPDLPTAWEVTYALEGAGEDGKIVRDGVGTFYIDNGRVVFDPEPGYVGKAEPVAVVATTAIGETLTAKYEPVVIGTANEFVLPSEAVQKQTGETAKLTPIYASNVNKSTVGFVDAKGTPLVDANGNPVKTLTVEKQGTWKIDKDGNFSFKPVEGFLGSPEPVQYTAKNTAGVLAKTPGTMIATYPEQRTVDSATADNVDVNQKSRAFTGAEGMFPTLPQNWKVKYALEGAGEDGKIVRDGVGTFSIDNGRVIFNPEPGYVGKAEPVTVVAKTATGETLTAKYEPVVIGVKPPTTTTTPTSPTSPTTPATTTPATTTPANPTTSNPKPPLSTVTAPSSTTTPASPASSSPETPGTTTPVTTAPGTTTTEAPTPSSPDTPATTTPVTTTPVTTTPSPTTTDPKETPTQPVPAPFVLPSKAVKGELRQPVDLEPAYADSIDRATVKIVGADEDGKLVVSGEGTWTVDKNGIFTFTPEDGFLGTPAPITYVAKDKDGNDAAAPGYIMAYYPAVAVADAIADANANPFILPSDAVNIAKGQSKVFPLVEMNNQIDPSTIKLKGATDGTLVVKGEGTWTVDTQTGTVTFTPEPNFEGTATPVTYTAASRKGVQSRYPAFLMVATEEFDPVPNLNEPKDPKGPKGPNQPPVVPTPKDDNASSQGAAGRCFGNAVRSPIAWLLPIGLLGYIGNELAAPFIGVYQEQLNQVNAELQARWNEATKDYQRDWGWGGGGRDNSRQSEAAAQLQAQINQINGQIQQIAGSPEVQQAGKVLGALVAIAAVGGLLYDWCSAEPGKAVTAIDFGNSDRKA